MWCAARGKVQRSVWTIDTDELYIAKALYQSIALPIL
jgi:hypothetical protein